MKEASVSEEKKKEVGILKELMGKYKVVGIIDLTGMPSPQLQRMRKKLENTLIRVTKKRLIKIALDGLKDTKKGIEQLKEMMGGNVMPCLILTNEDSFKLAKVLRKAKTNVAAKAGQISPRDLVVKEGPTPFAPGPIIGEFGALGIKAAVEGGKIVIKEESVIVKEGEEINEKVADMLMKLGIEPMEIGLNLIATYDNGDVFKKDVLDVDDQWYIDNIKSIASDGFKLAVEIGWVCDETVEFLLKKAEMEAKALGEPSKKNLTKKESVGEEKKEEPSLEKNVHEEKKEQPKVEEKPKEKKEAKKEEIKIEKEPKVEESSSEESFKKSFTKKESVHEEKKKLEIKESEKEEKSKIEIKPDVEALKKEPFKKPSAQELVEEVEKDIKKEEQPSLEKNVDEEKEERVPTAAELAARKEEKKKKEPEKVPSAAELLEKKKEKEEEKKE